MGACVVREDGMRGMCCVGGWDGCMCCEGGWDGGMCCEGGWDEGHVLCGRMGWVHVL